MAALCLLAAFQEALRPEDLDMQQVIFQPQVDASSLRLPHQIVLCLPSPRKLQFIAAFQEALRPKHLDTQQYPPQPQAATGTALLTPRMQCADTSRMQCADFCYISLSHCRNTSLVFVDLRA